MPVADVGRRPYEILREGNNHKVRNILYIIISSFSVEKGKINRENSYTFYVFLHKVYRKFVMILSSLLFKPEDSRNSLVRCYFPFFSFALQSFFCDVPPFFCSHTVVIYSLVLLLSYYPRDWSAMNAFLWLDIVFVSTTLIGLSLAPFQISMIHLWDIFLWMALVRDWCFTGNSITFSF
jgi:hypothetical protein